MKKIVLAASTRRAVVITAVLVLAVIAISFVNVYQYWNIWTYTGFQGKTLWDWLQLLVVPAVLAVIGLMYNHRSSQIQHDNALANQREAVLQNYIDNMSTLLLENDLQSAHHGSNLLVVAQTRTLASLRQLDGERKGVLLRFLMDAGLTGTESPIIKMHKADLQCAQLQGSSINEKDMTSWNLAKANFRGAYIGFSKANNANLVDVDFSNASFRVLDFVGTDFTSAMFRSAWLDNVNFGSAVLINADLRDVHTVSVSFRHANLTGADLRDATFLGAFRGAMDDEPTADFFGADLTNANLRGAKFMPGQLDDVKSLKGAIMPDGTRHK